MFVQQNPDLEAEFVMLQQSVIKPDNTVTLEDKSSLFKMKQNSKACTSIKVIMKKSFYCIPIMS